MRNSTNATNCKSLQSSMTTDALVTHGVAVFTAAYHQLSQLVHFIVRQECSVFIEQL